MSLLQATSHLALRVFLWVLQSSSLLKNHHFHIPIRPEQGTCMKTSWGLCGFLFKYCNFFNFLFIIFIMIMQQFCRIVMTATLVIGLRYFSGGDDCKNIHVYKVQYIRCLPIMKYWFIFPHSSDRHQLKRKYFHEWHGMMICLHITFQVRFFLF